MRRTFFYIAIGVICSVIMVSCKNKQSGPTPEEIKTQKAALADSVLAIIDNCAENLFDAKTRTITFRFMELTDAEKLAKPDYLLDPSSVNSLVTKSQKVNALGILAVDLGVRYLYEMPFVETEEAISKLAVELNLPIDLTSSPDKRLFSDITRQLYDNCKENNNIYNFWQLENAMVIETVYILVQNPELYFSKIDEVQFESLDTRWHSIANAIGELAQYDEGMATIANCFLAFESPDGESDADYATKETALQFLVANKNLKIARRNALLQ